jgi:hypothetical protein
MKVLKTIGFWLIQCTWGFILTFIGAITTLSLIIAGKKPQITKYAVCTKIGKGGCAFTLGGFIFMNEDASDDILRHEYGHTIQNLMFGPLCPFIVTFPSIIRFWLRKFDTHLKKSLFNLFYLLIALVITTGLACITGAWLHIKWLTIVIECLRMYFLLVSIWMSTCEIKKYDKGYVDYDAIWFEGQATRWGAKVFKK